MTKLGYSVLPSGEFILHLLLDQDRLDERMTVKKLVFQLKGNQGNGVGLRDG